jgi:hypothetical protein
VLRTTHLSKRLPRGCQLHNVALKGDGHGGGAIGKTSSLALWSVRAFAPCFVSGWRAFSSVSLCTCIQWALSAGTNAGHDLPLQPGPDLDGLPPPGVALQWQGRMPHVVRCCARHFLLEVTPGARPLLPRRMRLQTRCSQRRSAWCCKSSVPNELSPCSNANALWDPLHI